MFIFYFFYIVWIFFEFVDVWGGVVLYSFNVLSNKCLCVYVDFYCYCSGLIFCYCVFV